MTHASIPKEDRDKIGIADTLVSSKSHWLFNLGHYSSYAVILCRLYHTTLHNIRDFKMLGHFIRSIIITIWLATILEAQAFLLGHLPWVCSSEIDQWPVPLFCALYYHRMTLIQYVYLHLIDPHVCWIGRHCWHHRRSGTSSKGKMIIYSCRLYRYIEVLQCHNSFSFYIMCLQASQ